MELLIQRLSLCATILILICCEDYCVTGQLTLSPMVVAPVCHIGDPLEVTCTASVESIRWSIFRVINDQGTLSQITNSVLIDSMDDNQQKSSEVGSVTLTYARISAPGTSPLVSTLSIDSVSISLNGTVVNCSDVSNSMTSALTTIQIIDTSQNLQYTPTLNISEEQYHDADNVTVTVKWAQQVGVTYTIKVSPWVPLIYNGSTSLQLTISYNTDFNFSIEAITPCRDNITVSIRLQYANCGHPEPSSSCGYSRSVPKVLSDGDLPIEGSIVTFSCPPGLVLTGSNSSICTGNGEWEPDPSGLLCEDTPTCSYPFSSTANGSTILLIGYLDPATKGATITLECPREHNILIGPNTSTCMGNGEWEPDPRDVECRDIPTCSYPFRGTANGFAIFLIGYLDPATEGATITFECPHEHILIGSNTSTCMGNGEWEPDPREVECREIQKPPVEESTCLQMGVPVYIISVVSSFSIVVILVLSITFFVVGFMCGHCHGKGKCCYGSQSDNPRNVPIYEDVLPRVRDEADQKKGFKLRENVAYLSSKSIITELN